jgi:hypothetical protein
VAVAALTLALGLGADRHAFGQEDAKAVAARTFREGSAAFERHDFVAGARSFEASFRAIPRASAIYNAALCWDAAGVRARAADAYATALAKTDLHGAEAEKAAGRLRELEEALGVVEVTAPEGAHVLVEDVNGPPPLRVHVPPGRHEISVDLPTGQRQTYEVRVRAGEHAAVAASAPQSASAAARTGTAASGASAAEISASGRTGTASGSDRVWGWGLLGGGVAFAAAAVVLGAETMSSLSAFNASGDHDSVSHDRAVTLRTLTDISCGLAAALAGGGALLILWNRPPASRPTSSASAPSQASSAATATLGVGPAALWVAGRF